MTARLAVMLAIALLCNGLQAADPLPRARPESVGMSSERLSRITDTFRAEVENGQMPGAVIAVARRGKLVYYEAVGYLDKDAATPMPKDAIFAIASMTKPFVGVAVLGLAEEGRVELSDRLGRHLPAFAKARVGIVKRDATGAETIEYQPTPSPTLRDLLRQTAGMPYAFMGDSAIHKMYPDGSGAASLAYTGPDLIQKLASLPRTAKPGAAWEYGLATDVLGFVVEGLTRQTLAAALEDRIFKPLSMKDTAFFVSPERMARYARELPIDPVTGRPSPLPDFTKPRKFDCGGGCAVSTAGDYIRFLQMLLNGGRLDGQRILSVKSVELMTADHLTPEIHSELPPGYGFGLTVAVRRQAGTAEELGSEGEYLWWGAFGTSFWVDPKLQLAAVLMTHVPGPAQSRYRRLIKNLVVSAVEH